jgi:hypothetical protein
MAHLNATTLPTPPAPIIRVFFDIFFLLLRIIDYSFRGILSQIVGNFSLNDGFLNKS